MQALAAGGPVPRAGAVLGNYTPETAPVSAFVLARTFRFPDPTPAGTPSRSPARPKVSVGRRFKGVAQKASWRAEADIAVEALLDRLDTLAADLVMKPAMREFGLDFDQWIKLLGLIGHALLPEVYARPGEAPSHEGLIPPKGGRDAFPLTPRRVRALLRLMAEWDRGELAEG